MLIAVVIAVVLSGAGLFTGLHGLTIAGGLLAACCVVASRLNSGSEP